MKFYKELYASEERAINVSNTNTYIQYPNDRLENNDIPNTLTNINKLKKSF